MARTATAEIAGTALRNEWTIKFLWISGMGWAIAGFAFKEPLSWVAWSLGAFCFFISLQRRAAPFTAVGTAQRWFSNRLGMSLDPAEALNYAPLFSGAGDPRSALERVLGESDREVQVFMLRVAANEWAQAQGLLPPFPEEQRMLYQRHEELREEQTRSQEQARQQYRQEQSDRHQSPPPPPPHDAGLKVALTALGLGSMPATQDELKRAWRTRLRQYHPDRYATADESVLNMAHEMTLQINRAYEELCRSRGWRA